MSNDQDHKSQASKQMNSVWLSISLMLNVVLGLVSIGTLLHYLFNRRRSNSSGQSLNNSLAESNTQPLPAVVITKDKLTPAKEAVGNIQSLPDMRTALKHPDKKNNRVFIRWPETTQDYERYAIVLLGAAISINFVAIYYQSLVFFSSATDNARFATLFWAFSVGLAGLSARFFAAHSLKANTEARERGTLHVSSFRSLRDIVFNKNFLSLFAILLLAFVIRVIPIMNRGLQLDEWYWLDSAKYVLKGMVVSPFAFVGDFPTSLPAYPVAYLLLIVRNPLVAVRLIGVIYSLIAIYLVYFFVKKTLGNIAALCGALLMTFSVWDIHASGLGYLNVNISPMLVAAILFLLYQIWEQKHTFWTLFILAFLVSMCIHLLYVQTFLAVPVGLVLLIHWIKRNNGKRAKEIVLFALFFFISMSPIIERLIQYPDTIARHSEYLQQNLNLSGEAKTPLAYYWDQIILLRTDYTMGEHDFGRQGLWGITLDPLVQALSMIGILLIVIQVARKKRDPFWLVVVFMFCVQLLVPFVLLYRTASIWRAQPIFPLVYLFTVFALVEFSCFMKWIAQWILTNQKGLFTVFMTVNLALYFMINLTWFDHFFSGYAKAEDTYENTTCHMAAKMIAQNVPKYSVIYIPDELCFPLITIRFDEKQYYFVNVQSEDSLAGLMPSNYVLLLNSYKFGYFLSDIQTLLEREIGARQTETVAPPFDTLPVLYLIKK
jgi:hypothetical protein